MKIDGYSKHTLTHSHTLTRACISPPPPPPTLPHTHIQDLEKKEGERGDSTGIHSIKLEIITLIENKKMEGKKKSCYRSTYT